MVVEPLGHASIVHVTGDGVRLVAVTAPAAAPRPGDVVHVSLPAGRLHLFDRHGQRIGAAGRRAN
jgi:hypothetical protein